MMTIATYDYVLRMARRLALNEQLRLLQALLGEISSEVVEDATKKHSILELKGLGHEIWQDIDVEEYLQEERGSWAG